jgi:glucose/arabinose dehydrogenase
MSIFKRSELEQTFKDNPRLRASFERLDDLLSTTNEDGQTALEQLESLKADLADGGKYQHASALLTAIANLPNRIGAIEVKEGGEVAIRPIDSQDPASLMSRGVAYTVLVGTGGLGTTAQRPVLPQGYVAIYFDQTIDPDGQPIIRRPDGVWLNMSGVPV